jgi:hypothetical protein
MSAAAETYPTPEHGWTCFHCGETFAGDLSGQHAAKLHFGDYIDAIPACRLQARAGTQSLLRRIRQRFYSVNCAWRAGNDP